MRSSKSGKMDLRVLEWVDNQPIDGEQRLSIQQVDSSAIKHIRLKDTTFKWTVTDHILNILSSNLERALSIRTSINLEQALSTETILH